MKQTLKELQSKLSVLKSKKILNQNVELEIERVQKEIDKLKDPKSVSDKDQQTHFNNGTINAKIRGDATAVAIGHNAAVNADVVANHYNPQSFSNSVHNEYHGSQSIYEPSSSHVEVIVGVSLANWFRRAYNNSPQGVSVGIATALPLAFFLTPETAILGLIGILTVTPTGLIVLFKTNFMNIPEENFQNQKHILYASRFMRVTGFICIFILIISYYTSMVILSTAMGAVREQIFKR